ANLRQIPSALARSPVPPKTRNHTRGRANARECARPSARRTGSHQALPGNSQDAEHAGPESRPLFRCGRSSVLRWRISCAQARHPHYSRKNGENGGDENSQPHSRLGNLPIPLQRMPAVLPPEHLLLLEGDLAGTRRAEILWPGAGNGRTGRIALRIGVKQSITMVSQPLVSVVTPFHNTAAYLAECIESVLAQ